MSSTPTEIFKKRIREALELRELTQGELAEKTGLKPSAVSHFASGTRKPSFDNLKRIANALEVTTDYLIGRSDDPEGASESMSELNRHMQKIKSAEDREMAVNFVKMLAQKNKNKEDDE